MARHALTRPSVEIKIQEDFHALGGDTLAMLETYVEGCNVVIHFIGDMAGSAPRAASDDDLLKRRPELAARLGDKGLAREALGALTYTQWEAWLAVGFNQNGAKKNLVIVAPAEGVQDGESFKPTDASRASQAEHLRRLRAANLYPGPSFTSADDLAKQVLASAVLDALIAAGTPPKTKPRNLPLLSLGPLFAERDKALEADGERSQQGSRRCGAGAESCARTRRSRARAGAGGRAYCDRAHRLRPLSGFVGRSARRRARMVRSGGDRLGKDACDGLDNIGRAALAGEPAACSTGSPFWRRIRSPIRFSTLWFPARRQAAARLPLALASTPIR